MKKGVVLLAVLAMGACAMAGCAGKPAETAHTEITVFAAASMTETLDLIVKKYEEEHPEITVICNYDSSGTLKTQIEEGADCDIFISAAQKQMDQLDINAGREKNPDGLDLVDGTTRTDLLENTVVLAVCDENPQNINSYDELAAALKAGNILFAMGNEDVPVGQYTQKIFDYYGLDEKELASSGVITYCSNVKEVTTQVKEAAADCGVIYSTDAFTVGLKTVDTATPEMCGQVIYPAAVMKNSKHSEAAKEFLKYLSEPECSKIFESVGFTIK